MSKSDKQQTLVELKKKYDDLNRQEIELRNFLFQEELKAQQTVESLYQTWLKARDEAVAATKTRLKDKWDEVKRLRAEVADAGYRLNSFRDGCTHKNADGSTAIHENGFGYDPGDKMPLSCSICGETWT